MEHKLLSYEQKDTWIDRLCGVTKLIFFLCWSITCMLTYDTRLLAVMLILSLIIFAVSKIEWRQVGTVFKFVMLFMAINLTAIFLFAPTQGQVVYGTYTEIFRFSSRYVVLKEQLFYELNILLKYFTIVPSAFIFISTTNPSEFAASLNRIGVHYNIGYAIAIALRYIPDVQSDFVKIRNAQMARGIEMSDKGKLMDRIRNTASIIFPLIFTSMGRIDTISNAMELRSFGKNKKRTWYMGRPLLGMDYLVIIGSVAWMVIGLCITFADGSRFYNPFI